MNGLVMIRTSPILSAVLLVLVGAVASSCAFLIPPDPNIPRNNTVAGEERRPQLNPGGVPMLMRPEASMQRPAVVATSMPVPYTTSVSGAASPQVALAPAPVPPQYRSVPVENEMALQLAGNYPPLNTVPPRPVMDGAGSTRQELKDTRSDLESSRDAAEASKQQLEQDTMDEPTQLNAVPTSGTPSPAPAAVPAPSSSVVPTQTPVAQVIPEVQRRGSGNAQVAAAHSPAGGAALPAGARFAPPPPKPGMMSTREQADTAVSSPESLMPIAASPLPSTQTAFADIAVKHGDFNPLAVEDTAASMSGATPAGSAR